MLAAEHFENAPLARLVALAGHMASQRWARLVSESYGLSPAGASVLMSLSRERRMTHKELAQRCLIRPATLTGVVDTLVRSGHVERQDDEDDRRTVWVALTHKGVAVAAKVHRRLAGEGPRGSERAIRSLTSVDADPTNEAVIRRFLVELIMHVSEIEEQE